MIPVWVADPEEPCEIEAVAVAEAFDVGESVDVMFCVQDAEASAETLAVGVDVSVGAALALRVPFAVIDDEAPKLADAVGVGVGADALALGKPLAVFDDDKPKLIDAVEVNDAVAAALVLSVPFGGKEAEKFSEGDALADVEAVAEPVPVREAVAEPLLALAVGDELAVKLLKDAPVEAVIVGVAGAPERVAVPVADDEAVMLAVALGEALGEAPNESVAVNDVAARVPEALSDREGAIDDVIEGLEPSVVEGLAPAVADGVEDDVGKVLPESAGDVDRDCEPPP